MASEIRANTLKNRVGLGTISFTNTGPVVSGIVTANGLELNSVDAGSSAGPELKLFRNSASPADADYLGQLKFAGESDTGVERNYAKITGKILDASNGTEDGILEFAHIKGGSQTITGRWRSDSLQLLNGTSLTVSGDTTLTGDIDVDGHTNLDNVSIAGVTTFSNNVHLLDDDYLRIGGSVGSPDGVNIYHTSNHSYIKDTGTGRLIIQSSQLCLQDTSGNNHIVNNPGGSVQIYHDFANNSTAKIVTNSTGAQINTVLLVSGAAGNPGRLRFQEGGALSEIIGTRNSDANSDLQFKTERDDGTQVRAKIDYSGHFIPGADSTHDLGLTGTRWRNLYADTLYGDGSNLTGITGTTINNNANNRIITGSGSANTLEGESSFTYDGNGMQYITGTGAAGITITTPSSTDGGIYFNDGSNSGAIAYNHSDNYMRFRILGTTKVQITNTGNVDILTNARLRIGDGQEIQIYDNGGDGFIQKTGTGGLRIDSSQTILRDDNAAFYIQCIQNGDTKLYHSGNEKLSTKSDGVLLTSSGSWHGLFLTHSNGNEVFKLVNKGSGDEGYLALNNGGTATIQLDAEHGRVTATETRTTNTPRVLVSVDLAANSNHSAYGVQTVYHYGSGVFQVVFSANMPNDNYVTTASAVGSINGDGMVVAGIGGSTEYRTIGSLRMRVSYCTNNSGNDVTNVNLAFFTNA